MPWGRYPHQASVVCNKSLILPEICRFWFPDVKLGQIWPCHINRLEKTKLEPKFHAPNLKTKNLVPQCNHQKVWRIALWQETFWTFSWKCFWFDLSGRPVSQQTGDHHAVLFKLDTKTRRWTTHREFRNNKIRLPTYICMNDYANPPIPSFSS